MARESILARQYRLARAYVESEFPKSRRGVTKYYAPLVEAFVAGAKAERKQSQSDAKVKA